MQTFTNSPLVVYTKLSPNCTKNRNHDIDQIAIHTMAGPCSIETCGNIFANPSREASSNYGIDGNGRIGMYVEEKDRSWCTSSREVDHRAVTIEVASITSNEPYKCTDKAYEALINLCVDICRRNNIKKLLWKADKSLINQVEKQNVVVHRWTSPKPKSCPGNFLYDHLGDICSKVNAKLLIEDTPFQEVDVIKKSPEKIIWNYFYCRGFSEYATAGIMGNLFAESGLISNNLQNTFEKKFGMSDAQYTNAVDNGRYPNFANDGAGYGIAQWTYSVRKQKLLEFAKKRNASIADLEMQLDFLFDELKSYNLLMKILGESNDIKQCSDAFLVNFERPADMSDRVKELRAQYSKDIYKRNANKDVNNLPYIVKVNDKTGLNIRKGPGTEYDVVGIIKDNGLYTIVEESRNPVTFKNWGKLKSGLGWINLSYCIKTS